jgi:diguanylate cyclase (GGDEF)-like protein
MSTVTPRSLRRYVAAITAGGCLVLAYLAIHDGMTGLLGAGAEFWVLFLFVVVGELVPIRVPGHDGEMTVSTAFAFAILMVAGTAAAVWAAVIASVVADMVNRKPRERVMFNAAQYAISWAAAGLVLAGLAGSPEGAGSGFLAGTDILAVILAALVWVALNWTLAGVPPALGQRIRVRSFLRRDAGLQGASVIMLIGLAPLTVVAGEAHLWLITLLVLPMVGVWWAGQQAVVSEHQAMHDALTGLPNRTMFRYRAEQAIATARSGGLSVAVMVMDLDGFKEVNDTLGHHHGDLLLRQIGPRLSAMLDRGETVVRLGGDEFAVLLPLARGADAIAEARGAAERMSRDLERPFVVDGMTLDVRASIGIACFPDHGPDVDTLLQRADVAMYVAKEARSTIEVYAASEDRNSTRRLSLMGELRRSLERGELVVHYQPKADLLTGDVGGVEALVRWQHPEHGLIPPFEFIPIAEQTGLIEPMTLHIMDAALGQAAEWRDLGYPMSVAVNLSARGLRDRDLPAAVIDLLRRHGLDAGALRLEITESTIMADPARALPVLERLSEMGVALSVDDFGTGYSSLAYLKRLPVDELKIDRSFVSNLVTDRNDAVIVRSTIELARALGLQTVAEGVETTKTWSDLNQLGCDFAQGYLLSRPLPAEELTGRLRAGALVVPGLTGRPSDRPTPIRRHRQLSRLAAGTPSLDSRASAGP